MNTAPMWMDTCLKRLTFWQRLLTDLQVKAVFDLTPGSGSCARAAM